LLVSGNIERSVNDSKEGYFGVTIMKKQIQLMIRNKNGKKLL
jgi:hypothetical protein